MCRSQSYQQTPQTWPTFPVPPAWYPPPRHEAPQAFQVPLRWKTRHGPGQNAHFVKTEIRQFHRRPPQVPRLLSESAQAPPECCVGTPPEPTRRRKNKSPQTAAQTSKSSEKCAGSLPTPLQLSRLLPELPQFPASYQLHSKVFHLPHSPAPCFPSPKKPVPQTAHKAVPCFGSPAPAP